MAKPTPQQLQTLGKAWIPKPPKGYLYPYPHALAIFGLASVALNQSKNVWLDLAVDLKIHHDQESFKLQAASMAVTERWLVGNGPTYYPSTDIMELCLNTDIGKGLVGKDIRSAIPAALICFPDDIVESIEGVTHAMVGIYEKGQVLGTRIFSDSPPLTFSERMLLISYFDSRAGGGLCCQVSLEDEPLSGIVQGLSIDVVTQEPVFHSYFVAVINLLLIMQSIPTYVEPMNDKQSERRHYTDNGKTKPYSARIARPIMQVIQDNVNRPDSAVHTGRWPIKVHWRRGHWRRVEHSPQWEAVNMEIPCVEMSEGRRGHLSWIRPVLVNAALESTTEQDL